MRKGMVYNNKVLAGSIVQLDNGSFEFVYEAEYVLNTSMPAICLNMPKRVAPYTSTYLFPFFYNMLSEGINKKVQSRVLNIEEQDSFGFLLETAGNETIGAIRVEKEK